MEINKFIEEFCKAEDKEKYTKKHITKDYVNFEEKVAVSNIIAKKLVLENGDLIKNTPMVYMNFILSLVKEYTDIEPGEDTLAAFNLIEKNGITESLLSSIGKDAQVFNTVLDMTVNDTIDNHNNLVNHLSLKSDNINFILNKAQEMITKVPREKLSGNVAQSK